MKVLLVLLVVVASVLAQDDGVEYGGNCNGLLLQCNRHQNTVACTHREYNATIGGDTCNTGISVITGRCQCSRNCAADGTYHENGEWDNNQGVCVGFVGQLCTGLIPYCTRNAACSILESKCVCLLGYEPGPDGKHCVALANHPMHQ